MAHPDGTTVRVHYRGTLDDGTEFDSSAGRDPLEFTIGSGQVIPGFEQAVTELSIGDKIQIRLEPGDAYGERIADAVQRLPMEAFAEEPPLDAMVQLQSPDGQILVATVTDVTEEDVELDFNHPLAGKALTFDLELVDIIAPQ